MDESAIGCRNGPKLDALCHADDWMYNECEHYSICRSSKSNEDKGLSLLTIYEHKTIKTGMHP